MPTEAIAPPIKVLVFTCDQASTVDPVWTALGHPFSQAEVTHLSADKVARLLSPNGYAPVNWLGAVDWLRQQRFAAAVILTTPGQSPYTLGYLCYLAGIPIRIGRSQEFGGQVLTHCLAVGE